MIEAYEIGVSIALGDGVLEAISHARRELGLLQAGLKLARPSVEILRQTAQGAVYPAASVGESERRRGQPTIVARDPGGARPAGTLLDHDLSRRPPPDAGGTGGRLADFVPRLDDARPAPANGVSTESPVRLPAVMPALPPRAMGGGVALGRVPDEAAPRGHDRERRPQGARVGDRSVAPERQTPAPPGPTEAVGMAAPKMRQFQMAPLVPSVAPAPASRPFVLWAGGVEARVVPSVAPVMMRTLPPAGAPPGALDPAVAPMLKRAFGAEQAVRPEPALMPASSAPPVRRTPQKDIVQAPADGAASGGGASQGTHASTQPGQFGGDVILDGMIVGRWLSRHLGREATRASAGPTGFDARRGRLLPGATVGA